MAKIKEIITNIIIIIKYLFQSLKLRLTDNGRGRDKSEGAYNAA